MSRGKLRSRITDSSGINTSSLPTGPPRSTGLGVSFGSVESASASAGAHRSEFSGVYSQIKICDCSIELGIVSYTRRCFHSRVESGACHKRIGALENKHAVLCSSDYSPCNEFCAGTIFLHPIQDFVEGLLTF